jgi:5-formaminoimidazole-4-carboxamide-1-beta-D-ribofuranosyl 5'-monophosphate synthetase
LDFTGDEEAFEFRKGACFSRVKTSCLPGIFLYNVQNTMAKSAPILPASTDPKDFVIATIGSHSALQILKGAKDEGMRTLVICREGAERPYKSYPVADEIITIPDWSAWDTAMEEELIKRNAIIIPHGSFIAYIGHERVRQMQVMY